MKTLFKYIILLPLVLLAACSDYDIKGWQMSEDELTDTSIQKFVVKATHDSEQLTFEAKITENDSLIITIPKIYDISMLETATATVELANMVTISPDPAQEMDLTKEFPFTVTAPDRKTQRVYTLRYEITDKLEEGDGWGYAYELWFKTWPELGLADEDVNGDWSNINGSPNSVGVCGDYLVISRPPYAVCDRWTGELMDFTLNIEGITEQVFYITNDDMGNLIGCTLAEIGGNVFNIYTWDDPRQPARVVYESTIYAGRKLDVKGDIKGTAYISSWISNSSPMRFCRLKVENGVVTVLPEVNSNQIHQSGYPPIAFVEATEDSRYYVLGGYGGGSNSGTMLTWGLTPSDPAPQWSYGPLRDSGVSYEGTFGWGTMWRQNLHCFKVNGVDYVLVLNGNDWTEFGYHFIAVPVDRMVSGYGTRSMGKYFRDPIMPHLGSNINGTTGITIVNDGEECHMYILITGGAVSCHKITMYME